MNVTSAEQLFWSLRERISDLERIEDAGIVYILFFS